MPSGVLERFTRKGVGTWIIEEADGIAKEKGFKTHIAWVSDANVASVRRFAKLGFVKTEEFDIRNIPLAGGNHRYYKWRKHI